MFTRELKIQLNGIHPNHLDKTDIDETLLEIKTEAPYGATLKATYSAKDNIVKGMIHVSSSVGPFFAVATHESLSEVNRRLLEQMRRRFDKWKTKRFDHHSLKESEWYFSESNAS